MNTHTPAQLTRALALAILIAAGGCKEDSSPTAKDWPAVPTTSTPTDPAPLTKPPSEPSSPPTSAPTDAAEGVDIGGLIWKIPEGWTDVGASGMRIAEYSVSGAAGSAGIRFFATQGTSQANIDRWKGQVKDPTDGPTTRAIRSGAITAYIVTVTGTYSGMGPGGAPTAAVPGTRMLGAFVEGGPRPVQVVVTGSDEVVRSIEQAWNQMLMSVRPAPGG